MDGHVDVESRGSAMRLALILTEFPPGIGGMQTHADALARALHETGADLTVYTYRCDDPEHLTAARDFDRAAPYPVRRVLSRVGFWANHQWLRRELARTGPALVYASTVYYGLLGDALGVPVICRSVGNDVQRPWIAYPYRLGSRLISLPPLERRLHGWYRRWNTPEWIEAAFRRQRLALMRRSAQAHRVILANSDYTARLLRGAGVTARQVRVLPGGVDASRFVPCAAARTAVRSAWGVPPEAPVLLTACRLVAKKGIDFLVARMPVLRRLDPRIRLVVIGDGRERTRWAQQISAAALDDVVRLEGRVPQQDIQRYFSAADYFVLASRITTHRVSGLEDAETMGRVLCEANAAGVPVLASRSGGIPSVVTHEDNGLLFETDDGEDFVRQFRRLHEDAALRQRLVARGRERAEQEFAWPHLIEAHLRCFAEVACPMSH